MQRYGDGLVPAAFPILGLLPQYHNFVSFLALVGGMVVFVLLLVRQTSAVVITNRSQSFVVVVVRLIVGERSLQSAIQTVGMDLDGSVSRCHSI